MDRHPIDPIALVFGLLIGLTGAAIFVDHRWDDVDITAFAGAGVLLVGFLLAVLVVAHQIAHRSASSDDSDVTAGD